MYLNLEQTQGVTTMKRTTKLGLALLLTLFSTPIWAHHAAEGIISDEIWDEVDYRLQDTPHVDLDFSDIMGSMGVGEADEDGSMFLVSSITVEEADCALFLDTILDVLDDVTLDWTHDSSGNPIGDYSNTWLPVLIPDECVCVDGGCTLSLFEPIGSIGWSDDPEEVYTPPDAPGPGKNKGGK